MDWAGKKAREIAGWLISEYGVNITTTDEMRIAKALRQAYSRGAEGAARLVEVAREVYRLNAEGEITATDAAYGAITELAAALAPFQKGGSDG